MVNKELSFHIGWSLILVSSEGLLGIVWIYGPQKKVISHYFGTAFSEIDVNVRGANLSTHGIYRTVKLVS